MGKLMINSGDRYGNLTGNWNSVVGYEDLYLINNTGKIYNLKRYVFIKQGINTGYGRVSLNKNGSFKRYYVHRLVALAFLPNPENKKEVNHINGNKLDNNVSNLEWCTPQENIQHAWLIGLNKRRPMSNSHKQKTIEINSKKVVDTKTGVIYSSATEAARKFSIKKSTLIHYLLNSRKNKTSLTYA